MRIETVKIIDPKNKDDYIVINKSDLKSTDKKWKEPKPDKIEA